ncbi:hypothetical protein CPB84DRAFT_1784934 [Gymnopilus junonius]|uniref:Uncharacterized protein n=1 Tax=Gymnopilus junonius TaxID=109634 RepID=A0A9P5NID8_GYMJU|nr:hypothetical protein CPB84DRAFT_1784934 [Gymnopilus junonius]
MSSLRVLYDHTISHTKVVISVLDKDKREHHVVVPVPKSYEAALAIAFDQLGEYIPNFKPGSLLMEGAYFEYGLKSITGTAVWAKLPPEFWNEIVKDGDQLRICVASPRIRTVMPAAGWSQSTFVDPNSGPIKRMARFVQLVHKPSKNRGYIRIGRTALVPEPKTYKIAKDIACSTFYQGRHMKAMELYVKLRDNWEEVRGGTSSQDWKYLMESSGAQDVEIAVWGTNKK